VLGCFCVFSKPVRSNEVPRTFSFVAWCPSLPAWFVNWVSEDETSSEVSFAELEASLAGNEDFDAYMRYRLEEIEIHPDDLSISFLGGKTPTGLPFLVDRSRTTVVTSECAISMPTPQDEAERIRLLPNPLQDLKHRLI